MSVSDWLHDLPVPWMALAIFGFTYLLAAVIHVGIAALAAGERAKSFKAVSSSMLPVLGIIFGLFVVFTAAQVWSDNDHATATVSREASALRSVTVFATAFPGEPETKLRGLVRDYVQEAATVEWPLMAHEAASLKVPSRQLTEALQLVLSLPTNSPGQQTAQREIISGFETALDARRQRIIVSLAEVSLVKWCCLYLQAASLLFAIGLVHCDDRLASLVAMGLFATGAAAAVLLIAAYDRPFIGQLSITPEPLLQIMPDAPAAH
jgi:Protein of unknown function (DUF4239)